MKMLITLTLLLGFHISGNAQVIYSINPDESSLTIQGTSSVHDWESNVENFDIEITLTESDEANINIESLLFEAEVSSIKSGSALCTARPEVLLKLVITQSFNSLYLKFYP